MSRAVYWRFSGGRKSFRYGWMTRISGNLWRMGFWCGDDTQGPIVDVDEIEVRGA